MIGGRKIRIENSINKALNEDFEELKKNFTSNKLYTEDIDKKINKYFKTSHKSIYTLCLWSHHFNESSMRQRIFLEEMRSDAIQSLQLSLLNLERPISLLFRSMIENILKHIYYYDHEIEYERLEKEEKYYQRMEVLWDYLKKHPRLDIYKKTDMIGRLETEYSKLSRYVHSKGMRHMSLTKSLEDISFNEEYFIKYCKQLNHISICLHYLLLTFYNQYLGNFNPPWKFLILEVLPKKFRSII